MTRILAVLVLLCGSVQAADKIDDPLAPWRKGVKVAPVFASQQHTMHAYFNTSPESPDGRWVVGYASTAGDGHQGEIRVLERATGKEKVLYRDIAVEDAHRVACQQWTNAGKTIVFHNLVKPNTSVVMAVDLDTGRDKILAQGRQVGFGQPHGAMVPIYGPHWNPGKYRDLELVNVETGAITTTALTAADVQKAYPAWVARQFGDGPVSIYIPMLSPDLKKVFFKLGRPAGGDVRSSKASVREGLLCYDLVASRMLFQHDRWGHPAWNSNSRHIINVPGIVIDSTTGKSQPIPNVPKLPGSHPSFSPDGKLFTSDAFAKGFGGSEGQWVVGVGDVRTGEFIVVHTFDHSKGARSWRISHPHPVFSGEGKRLYFNVSADEWTRLHVAEVSR